MLCVSLVHEALLLVDELDLELLLTDLLKLHLAGDLFLHALLLGFAAPIASLLLMRVLLEKGLVLLLLPLNAVHRLFVILVLLGRLLGGGICKLSKTYLCFRDVLGQDVVDVAVLLLLLRLHLFLPARLEDRLKLLLLLKAELVGIFKKLD